MVDIKELYITNTGNDLYIDASVKDSDFYTDVYISDVYILNQDQYKETIIPDELSDYQMVYHEHFDNVKSIQGSINSSEINVKGNFSEGLYIVYIRCTGMPSFDTPCGMDNEYTIGVVYNTTPIYRGMTKAIKGLERSFCNPCAIPDEFIDAYLKVLALNCEIKAGNFSQACVYYTKFFKNKIVKTGSTCTCNG